MFKAVEEREYLDYDYLSDEEIIYQGYDTDRDSDYSVGFTVTEYERKAEASENPEKGNDEAESRDSEVDAGPDDDDIWLDGDEDINENAEPDDEQTPDESETDDEEEAWYEDDAHPGEKASPESYTIDGHEYKDPRRYIQAL